MKDFLICVPLGIIISSPIILPRYYQLGSTPSKFHYSLYIVLSHAHSVSPRLPNLARPSQKRRSQGPGQEKEVTSPAGKTLPTRPASKKKTAVGSEEPHKRTHALRDNPTCSNDRKHLIPITFLRSGHGPMAHTRARNISTFCCAMAFRGASKEELKRANW